MAHAAAPPPTLRRARHGRVALGVCAGIARRVGVDPLVVRVVFVAFAFTGGLGVLLYLLGWAVLPDDAGGTAGMQRLQRSGRAAVEVGAGTGLLVLAALLVLRETGVWFSDAVVWPAVLVAAGGALIWRSSGDAEVAEPPPAEAPPAAALTAPAQNTTPPRTGALGDAAAAFARARLALVSRTGLGIALVVAAALVFLQATGVLTAARDVALVAFVVAASLAVILAPWILRLVRSLSAERSARIRSQERAEVAAHLHDSVLQTLALVQRRSDDPREVAALARRQERELRAWLSGRTERASDRSVAAALERAAAEVEEAHGGAIEVVTVGDRDLDERGEALVAAAREAMVNAAKFAGDAPVSVFLEVAEERLHAWVRDRGPGFEPEAVPADRRGVRESIVGRMARHGGRASVVSAPGAGTEVELEIVVSAKRGTEPQARGL